jgi:hypothetical protein
MTNIELNAMMVKASKVTREMSNGELRMSNLFREGRAIPPLKPNYWQLAPPLLASRP